MRALVTAVALLGVACRSQSAEPPRSPTLPSIVLPLELRAVASLAVGPDGVVWIVGMDGSLRQVTGSTVEKVVVPQASRVASVAVSSEGPYVVYDDAGGVSHLARLTPQPTLLPTPVEPRAVASGASVAGVWFTSVDTSLRGPSGAPETGRYNAVAVSPSGRYVAARGTPDDVLQVRATALNGGPAGWVSRGVLRGMLLGVDDRGHAFALELEPAEPRAMPKGVVFQLDAAGKRTELRRGAFVAGAVGPKGLVLVEQTSSGFTIVRE